MKKYLSAILLATLVLAARAETITNVLTLDLTSKAAPVAEPKTHELTFDLAGVTSPTTGKSEVGMDFSLSIQPSQKLPIWCGVAQSIGWQPSLSGATDLDAYWVWNIYKETVYLNTGWSGGAVYDSHTLAWRSGPEVSVQYYFTDSVFSWAQVNWDVIHTGAIENDIRYSAGLGFAF